jgi:hypothetical protein
MPFRPPSGGRRGWDRRCAPIFSQPLTGPAPPRFGPARSIGSWPTGNLALGAEPSCGRPVPERGRARGSVRGRRTCRSPNLPEERQSGSRVARGRPPGDSGAGHGPPRKLAPAGRFFGSHQPGVIRWGAPSEPHFGAGLAGTRLAGAEFACSLGNRTGNRPRRYADRSAAGLEAGRAAGSFLRRRRAAPTAALRERRPQESHDPTSPCS